MLNTCAKYASHANSAISEASMRYSSLLLDCIANKECDFEEDIMSLLSSMFDIDQLLLNIRVGLNGKSSQGKADARHCCQVLVQCFGELDYEDKVNGLESISNTQVFYYVCCVCVSYNAFSSNGYIRSLSR